jgi:hypothetical protein
MVWRYLVDVVISLVGQTLVSETFRTDDIVSGHSKVQSEQNKRNAFDDDDTKDKGEW